LSLLFSDPDGHPVAFSIPQGTTTIGGAGDNDLVLDHESVAAHQVVLMREGDELTLQDLFAGVTQINGEERRTGALSPGDVLSLGEVRLRVMRVAPSGKTQRLVRDRATTRRLRLSGVLKRAAVAPRPQLDAPGSAAASSAADAAALAASEAARKRAEEEARQAQERDARRARALARARQLVDEIMVQDDFEDVLEKVALGFLEIYSADRAVTILFEEDGRNPLLTVERLKEGSGDGAGVAQEIIDRCLQVRSVIRVADGVSGLAGLAAPLITRGRALGLIYFERGGGQAMDLDEVHVMAMLGGVTALLIAPLIE
jgi:pSer/pThr/pTyr-binding forkhead associated (FHA) protein